jgi:glycosyltransferase involved in cell wall biosynthesis
MEAPTYSIVIPVFNEEETLEELLRRLRQLMESLDAPAEVVAVDDGSFDRSPDILAEVAGRDHRFKVIELSRNFGHQIAITAGLDFATGEAIVVMDADLQDPPDVVLDMVAKWRDGFEVVYAVREHREGERFFKQATARIFYRALRRLTDVDAPLDVGDFRLVDRRALQAFKAMRENNRYVRGMFSWIGFRQVGVPYTRAKRFAGDTKYPLRKMLKFASDAIFSFSNAPLRFALNLGFALALLSMLGGTLAVIFKITGAYVVTGWASLVVAISFLGGIQLIVLGAMGEYIARIHDEVKNRPLYIIRETRGFNVKPQSGLRRLIVSAGPTCPVDEEQLHFSPPS